MRLDPLLFGPQAPKKTKSTEWIAIVCYVLGGLLLVWSASIHVRLWKSEGYRDIPTIGTLFIVQSVVGMVVGVAVAVFRRVWAALVGIGFAISTMAGFLLSLKVGLFGFQDTWSAPFAQQAFFIEVAAAAVLIVAGALCLRSPAGLATTGASQSSLECDETSISVRATRR